MFSRVKKETSGVKWVEDFELSGPQHLTTNLPGQRPDHVLPKTKIAHCSFKQIRSQSLKKIWISFLDFDFTSPILRQEKLFFLTNEFFNYPFCIFPVLRVYPTILILMI